MAAGGWRFATGALRSARLPIVSGHREACLACHGGVRGLGTHHDPAAIGCTACHRGDGTRGDAAGAHRGMVLVPGNLDATLEQTCARSGCHVELAARVRGSPMATARGMVSVDRWAFGEAATPDAPGDGGATLPEVLARPDGSLADGHLRQLCGTCHLGATKAAPAPVGEGSRGGGCLACHLVDDPPRTPVAKDPAGFVHPGLTLRVRDASCFGCHSRSGRIALSYSGLHEVGPGDAAERRLADGRPVARTGDDVHHARGLGCVDCHTARELMGDGTAVAHEEEATRVRCTTCHRERPARIASAGGDLDAEAALIVLVRDGERAAGRYLVEDGSGEALTGATPLPDGTVEVRGKIDGARHLARPPAPACRAIAGHGRLSCQACHAAWAPRCVGCHTQRAGPASWVEYDVAPAIAPPTLGLFARGGRRAGAAASGPPAVIEPFVPGMVMTLDREAPRGALPESSAALVSARTPLLRAYAFAVPHTVTRAGRSCASCHLDPIALGYGAGRLELASEGGSTIVRFVPRYQAAPGDGLPADAWIAPDSDDGAGRATRSGARPLDRATRTRVLFVGACLTCHDPATPAGRALFERFPARRDHRSPRCKAPDASQEGR